MNILIIDSDRKTAGKLAALLRGWGYTPVHANCEKEAMALSRQSVFEVILMELVAKGIPLYEAIPDLKLYHPGVSVITMIQESSPELEKKARERGIAYYLGKPADPSQLKQILDRLAVFHRKNGDWKKVTII